MQTQIFTLAFYYLKISLSNLAQRIFYNTLIPFLICIVCFDAKATIQIDASSNGDFHNGTSGWTFVNGNTTDNPNQWHVGGSGVYYSFDENFAYISNNGGTWQYTSTKACFTHFYRDVTIPAGEKEIELTFDWICSGEALRDGLQVSYATTSTSVSANTSSYNSTIGDQTGTLVSGATLISPIFLNLSSNTEQKHFYAKLPATLASSTTSIRLIFSWRNDAATTNQNPAGIDNIVLTSNHIGRNKTLFVDLFGLTIFDVDEQGDNTYEREDELIDFAVRKGFSTLILSRLDQTVYGNNIKLFPKGSAVDFPNLTSQSGIDMYERLASFLVKCRKAGIMHLGVSEHPYYKPSNTYQINQFFDNVVLFNEFYSYSSGSTNYDPLAYFDILYGEEDYWNTNEPHPTTNVVTNWTTYYYPGIQHMHFVKTNYAIGPNSTTKANTRITTTATYVGDFRPLSLATGGTSAQGQADAIDANMDWVYVDFYFGGANINNSPPTMPVEFFDLDGTGSGFRLEKFANNSTPTTIIPIFGSSSANTA